MFNVTVLKIGDIIKISCRNINNSNVNGIYCKIFFIYKKKIKILKILKFYKQIA